MKKFKKALALLMASAIILSSGAIGAYATEAKSGNLDGLIIKQFEKNGHSMYLDGESSTGVSTTDKDDVYDSSLPSSYDLRDYNKVTEASEQYYEDCWSYAAIASLESNSLSTGYGKNLFSRSHLCNFTFNPAIEGPKDDNVWSCGGNSFYSAITLMNLEGIASRSNYPDKTTDSYTIPESARYCHDSGYVFDDAVTLTDNNEIKEYIMNNGAVYADYYSEPLYDCVYSQRYKTDMIYTPNTTYTNHAIAIVGWDDTIPASEFTVNGRRPSVNGGWLIKNSWTGSDDETFYMYISYGQAIENVTGFSIKKDTDTYKNYTHASRGGENLIGDGGYLGFGGVYTAESNERINEVGVFYFTENADTETEVKVSVYKNLPDTNSLSAGAPSYTFSETLSNDGFYTLKLPKAVSVSKGENFGITVEYFNQSGTSVYTITEKNNYKLFHGYTGKYKGAESQSFVRVDRNENFADMYEQLSSIGVCDVFVQVYTSCNHTVTKSADGLVNNCSQCNKALEICDTHTEGYSITTKSATYTEEGEIDICCTACGEVVKSEATPKLSVPSIKIRNNPGSKEVKYGNYLKLYADVENGNDNCYVRWRDSTNDETLVSSIVYYSCTKNFTAIAELVDKDGNPILDENGNPIRDTENVTVKPNIFLIIITFIKSLFGIIPPITEN